MTIWLEVLGWARGFLVQHWAKVGTAVAVVTLPLAIKGCVHSCPPPAPVTASAAATQAQGGSLSNSAKAIVRYIHVPGKCPEIVVEAEASGLAAGSQAQAASATAQIAPFLASNHRSNGLWLGAGWWGGHGQAYGKIGYQGGNGRVDFMANTSLAYGVELGYKLIDF